MRISTIKIVLVFISILLVGSVFGQRRHRAKCKEVQSSISNKYKTQEGFINILKAKDKIFLEIPQKILGKDLLIASRAIETELTKGLAAGQMIYNPILVKFEKDDKIIKLVVQDTKYVHDKTKKYYKSYLKNHQEEILKTFKISSFNKENDTYRIDFTEFIINPIKKISPFTSRSGINKGNKKLNKIEDTSASTVNLEFVVQNTAVYKGKPCLYTSQKSILLLDNPMKPRLESKEIGYYSIDKKIYNSNTGNFDKQAFIKRWRIEPKKQDIKKYKAGKLVEPAKPIVFYIDDNFPEAWQKYIKLGIEDWQKAFEKIGFKNAIQAKFYPKNAKDIDMNAISKSCFRYIYCERANAMGNSWIDPRSGEIIQGDVLWFHGVVNKLFKWRFVQTAANDQKIRTDFESLDTQLLGRLIRYAAAHEIGHSLGLKHNYRASYAYDLDSLRSASFTKEYGTAASIMDYARNNYLAQPEDKGLELSPPILGVYDYFSIEWAYKPSFESNPIKEKQILNSWIDKHKDDPFYLFGGKNNIGDGNLDPSCLTESLSNDIYKASVLGIKNTKLIMKNLIEWSKSENNAAKLSEMRAALIKQYRSYIKHCISSLGGVYKYKRISKISPSLHKTVSPAEHEKLVSLIIAEIKNLDTWINPQDHKQLLGDLTNTCFQLQSDMIKDLLDKTVIIRISKLANFSNEKQYTVQEYLNHLEKGLKIKNPKSDYQYNIIGEYKVRLNGLIDSKQTQSNPYFRNIILPKLKK